MRMPSELPKPEVRALTATQVRGAAELIQLTNDGIPAEELAADLLTCWQKWPQIQIGAWAGGTLIGAIAGRIDSADPTIGWSDDIVVIPEWRSAKVGKLLLEAQLEGFRAIGCKRVRGRSPRRLFGSVGFFERHGFRVIDETVAQGIWGIEDGEPLWLTERIL